MRGSYRCLALLVFAVLEGGVTLRLHTPSRDLREVSSTATEEARNEESSLLGSSHPVKPHKKHRHFHVAGIRKTKHVKTDADFFDLQHHIIRGAMATVEDMSAWFGPHVLDKPKQIMKYRHECDRWLLDLNYNKTSFPNHTPDSVHTKEGYWIEPVFRMALCGSTGDHGVFGRMSGIAGLWKVKDSKHADAFMCSIAFQPPAGSQMGLQKKTGEATTCGVKFNEPWWDQAILFMKQMNEDEDLLSALRSECKGLPLVLTGSSFGAMMAGIMSVCANHCMNTGSKEEACTSFSNVIDFLDDEYLIYAGIEQEPFLADEYTWETVPKDMPFSEFSFRHVKALQAEVDGVPYFQFSGFTGQAGMDQCTPELNPDNLKVLVCMQKPKTNPNQVVQAIERKAGVPGEPDGCYFLHADSVPDNTHLGAFPFFAARSPQDNLLLIHGMQHVMHSDFEIRSISDVNEVNAFGCFPENRRDFVKKFQTNPMCEMPVVCSKDAYWTKK